MQAVKFRAASRTMWLWQSEHHDAAMCHGRNECRLGLLRGRRCRQPAGPEDAKRIHLDAASNTARSTDWDNSCCQTNSYRKTSRVLIGAQLPATAEMRNNTTHRWILKSLLEEYVWWKRHAAASSSNAPTPSHHPRNSPTRPTSKSCIR